MSTNTDPPDDQTPIVEPQAASAPDVSDDRWGRVTEYLDQNGIDPEQLSNLMERAQWVPENETAESLQRKFQYADYYTQVAPQLTEFQKWQQEQQQAQAAANKPPEEPPLFEPRQLTSADTRGLSLENGRWVATNPADQLRAQRANEALDYRNQFSDTLFNDPSKVIGHYASQATKSAFAEMRKELDELKAFHAQTTQQQSLQNVFAEKYSLFTQVDPQNPTQRIESPAWTAFTGKYAEMLNAGVPADTAKKFALELAEAVAPQQAAQRPRQQQKPADSRTFSQIASGAMADARQQRTEPKPLEMSPNDPRYLQDLRNRAYAQVGAAAPSDN